MTVSLSNPFIILYLQHIYFETKFYQTSETYVNTFEIMTFILFSFPMLTIFFFYSDTTRNTADCSICR